MTSSIFSFTLLALAGVGACIGTARAGNAVVSPGPVTAITTESGVIPKDTALVVRTDDTVNTRHAYRETIYEARLAEDVVDQHGNILIPKSSPVELGVRRSAFLGPGGAGMAELVLGVRGITVNGVYYRVATQGGEIDGGLTNGIQNPKWIGGGDETGRVATMGRHVNIPAGALLAFQTSEPIRLSGYQR